MNRKLEVTLAIAALAIGPLANARENAPYPHEKLATFVVDKLDLTSLPSAYRPKKEKGKKTVTDYGFSSQTLEEKEALVAASGGAYQLSIRILQQSDSGIYACLAQPAADGPNPKAQSVVLLKRKEDGGLLKGRENWREFAACPVVGRAESPVSIY
jgi:hypothetical protein